MKRYLRKCAFCLMPVALILALYCLTDPFKVLRAYDCYYESGRPMTVTLNKDHVNTSLFLRQREKYGWDSYIFGNSRSIFWNAEHWKQRIGDDCHPFHFDASAETLYAIRKKVMLIDRCDAPMHHVLLILDHETLSQITPRHGHLYAISPLLDQDRPALSFQSEFIRSFLTPRFLTAYIDYKVSGKIRPYMTQENIFSDAPLHYERSTNQITYPDHERLIGAGLYYTSDRQEQFYRRNPAPLTSPAAIEAGQEAMLREIKTLFDKHKTEYRIVINPLYDQRKLHPADLRFLRELFGERFVYDFSGKNSLTEDCHNYYETSHYRPHVADRMLEFIYSDH